MKTLKTILLAAVALCAVNASAVYTISVTTSPAQFGIPGSSGQSYFDVSFSGGGVFTYTGKQLWAVNGSDPDNNPIVGGDSPFSSLTIDPSSTLLTGAGKTYNSGQTYRLIVDWTISSDWAVSDTYGIYFNLFVKQPDNVAANAGATDLVNINASPVPEPSQVLAGSLILGCGVLIFTGRRWMKKNT
jgi:hypothetical protein